MIIGENMTWCEKVPVSTFWVHQFHRVSRTVSIRRNASVLIPQRIHAQPHGHQFVFHIAGTEVAEAGLLVALLTVFCFIHWCSPPLTGVIAGGNIGVIPYGLHAAYPLLFDCWTVLLVTQVSRVL